MRPIDSVMVVAIAAAVGLVLLLVAFSGRLPLVFRRRLELAMLALVFPAGLTALVLLALEAARAGDWRRTIWLLVLGAANALLGWRWFRERLRAGRGG